MAERISLQVGQRYRLESGRVILHLLSGKADLFAFAGESRDQIFLDSRQQDDWFFYLGGNGDNLRLMLLAKDEIELETFALADLPRQEELPGGMLAHLTEWLQNLWQVNWMHREVLPLLELMETAKLGNAEPGQEGEENSPLCADWLTNPWHVSWVREFSRHGKLDLAAWRQANGGKSLTAAAAEGFLAAQQKTLAILLNMHAQGRKEAFEQRVLRREQKTLRMMESATRILLGKVDTAQADAQVESQTEGLGRLILVALEHFKMEPADLTLPQFMQDKLRGDELLKVLLKKANILYRRVLLEQDWHKRDNGLLLFQLQGEQVLAEPLTDHSYQVRWADGRTAPLTDELAAQVSSLDAWRLYASFPKHALKLRDLLTFIRNQSWAADWWTVLLVSFAAGLIPLLTPVITDKLFSDVIPIHDYAGVATITQVMVVSAFTSAMLSFVRGIAVQRLNLGCGIALDAALWGRVLSLPISFFKGFSAGELNQRIMGLDVFKNLLSNQMVSTIFNCLFSFWSLLLMFYYTKRLTLAAVGMWLVYLLLSWLIFYRQPDLNKKLVKESNANSSLMIQLFAGLSKFRCRGAEEQAFYLWSRTFGKKWQTMLSMRQLDNCSNVLNAVLTIVMMMVLYYYVMDLAKEPQTMVAPGDFIAFWAAYTGFNGCILSMVQLGANLIGLGAFTDNVKPVLEAVPEEQGDKLDAGRLTGEIELQNVTFAYEEGKDILKDISLYIRPGESVAIVGPSGCGKSTLLRLLLGFERPQKGIVFYDRRDLADLSPESVRRQLGVVLQDGKLLPGNILQNIIGTQDLTLEDAWNAAAKVGLDKDVREMPLQMDTIISEDAGNISGGQRQRILLARSLAGHPAIMVLDEATSALDNKTQAIVSQSLEALDCTRIVVAHRLSTIRNADHIIVLNKGSIAEEGSYDELMQKDGLFAKLAKRQIA